MNQVKTVDKRIISDCGKCSEEGEKGMGDKRRWGRSLLNGYSETASLRRELGTGLKLLEGTSCAQLGESSQAQQEGHRERGGGSGGQEPDSMGPWRRGSSWALF